MKLLGVTGGVGMGKSTSADILEHLGARVVDTDDLARLVVASGHPALEEVKLAFGNEIVGSDGTLNRGGLARRVFADPDQRRRLEAILHPRIRALWQAMVATWRREGAALGVVVIPLLFETGAEGNFDAVICVACSTSTQRRRLEARGWGATELEQRVAAQLPTTRKMDQSQYVIWTEGDLDVHEAQWRRILS